MPTRRRWCSRTPMTPCVRSSQGTLLCGRACFAADDRTVVVVGGGVVVVVVVVLVTLPLCCRWCYMSVMMVLCLKEGRTLAEDKLPPSEPRLWICLFPRLTAFRNTTCRSKPTFSPLYGKVWRSAGPPRSAGQGSQRELRGPQEGNAAPACQRQSGRAYRKNIEHNVTIYAKAVEYRKSSTGPLSSTSTPHAFHIT